MRKINKITIHLFIPWLFHLSEKCFWLGKHWRCYIYLKSANSLLKSLHESRHKVVVKRDVFLQLCLSQVIQNETKNRRVLPLVVVSTWLLESVGSRRLPRLPDVTSFVAIARSPIPNAFSVLKKHRWEHGGAKTNWTQITLSSFLWFLCYFLKFLCWIVCGGRFCFCMIEICQTCVLSTDTPC